MRTAAIACAACLFAGAPATSPAGTGQFADRPVIAPLEAPFAMDIPALPAIPAGEFDRQYGAREGGEFKNTAAIRAAVRAASQAGGGAVVIPAGKWLTGSIRLENNVALRVSKGAELLFSSDPADYLPVVFARHEEIECYGYAPFHLRPREERYRDRGEREC